MNKVVYNKHFTNLWEAFDLGLGSKGSKFKAYGVFQKQKINEAESLTLIHTLEKQQISAYKKKALGAWVENFPHVERWLKHRRWEDEIED